MFTVTGTIDSIPYQVSVHNEPVPGELNGCVMGSNNATALLSGAVGDQVTEAPTHGPVTLDLSDPVSILIALRQHTDITHTEGDVPATFESVGSGVIH